jgi:hypothetical protein
MMTMSFAAWQVSRGIEPWTLRHHVPPDPEPSVVMAHIGAGVRLFIADIGDVFRAVWDRMRDWWASFIDAFADTARAVNEFAARFAAAMVPMSPTLPPVGRGYIPATFDRRPPRTVPYTGRGPR